MDFREDRAQPPRLRHIGNCHTKIRGLGCEEQRLPRKDEPMKNFKSYSTQLSPDLIAQLKQHREKTGVPDSVFVRRAIEAALSKKKEAVTKK